MDVDVDADVDVDVDVDVDAADDGDDDDEDVEDEDENEDNDHPLPAGNLLSGGVRGGRGGSDLGPPEGERGGWFNWKVSNFPMDLLR